MQVNAIRVLDCTDHVASPSKILGLPIAKTKAPSQVGPIRRTREGFGVDKDRRVRVVLTIDQVGRV